MQMPKPQAEKHMPRTAAVVRDIIQARKAIIAAAEASPAASLARQKKINPTALKVKLMKLKMKARGDKGLPEHERVYLEIRLPDGQQKPYFFSKLWTVGRCMDYVCDNEGIPNDNNRVNAKRLFLQSMERSVEGGFSRSLDLSSSMESLLKKDIIREADELNLTYHGSQ
ncbi:AN1-type zinc finger protein 1-like [Varroa jacobsoni]|uniref:ZFAND1-like ubiquitin-like domain-containing protein n=1 Tax=Varroa destructor TaxID=109461 RepID=A0A7M7K8T5_VARDE|nr:AN1-type zinc finger protein 1-like [Varroa destructor]XP_022705486.1 AN1-type zinc finger protein 1-like [Varroa jacobsoni]